MDLKHIYILSEVINKSINDGGLPKDFKDNAEICLTFDSTTYYGIDKEFYYMTHNNSYNGFVHSPDMVNATIDGIKFKILPQKKEEE